MRARGGRPLRVYKHTADWIEVRSLMHDLFALGDAPEVLSMGCVVTSADEVGEVMFSVLFVC